MCGRYVSPDIASIEAVWHIGRINSNPFPQRFNVAPTTDIPILRLRRDTFELELDLAKWSFTPSWWKNPKPPSHCINARVEEAATKPMWKHAYRYARCLVPALGYYEWQEAKK